jgi:hypothetical protein
MFLGGPGAVLKVKAPDVRLENLHFLRVHDKLAGEGHLKATAMIDLQSDRITLSGCSFQDLSGQDPASCAIRWTASTGSAAEAAVLEGRNIVFRQVSAGVMVSSKAASQLILDNCLHLGPGPLVHSTSSAGQPFEALDVNLSRVTVYGACTLVHSFPHPVDDVLPLRIVAQRSFLVPRDREQPILAVAYASQPGMLMPKVSWSGSGTVCPADATLLDVSRGPDASPWRATDIAAWNAYWGTHATGLIGVRMAFANRAVSNPAELPRPRLESDFAAGIEPGELCFPSPVALEQLPLLVERLVQH